MNALSSTFNGKKIVTRGGGVAILCLTSKNTNPFFGYMWIKNSDYSPAKKGDRWISLGDQKSKTGIITSNEWAFAKTWKDAKVEPMTEEEISLAINLASEVQKDPLFQYEEKDHTARANYMQKKIEKTLENVK